MRTRLVFIVTAAFAPAAHAGFFVTDGPAPIQAGPVIQRLAATDTPVYKVPFLSRSSQISPAAKRALDAILASAQDAASVSIAGCGDARDSDAVAYRRASAIKGWLIDNGVSPNGINVITDSDSSVMRSGRFYNCSISMVSNPPLARAEVATLRAASARSPLTPAAYSPSAATGQAAPTGSSDDQTLALIRRVLDMTSRKVLKPEDAIAMLQEISKAGAQLSGDQTQQAAPAPSYAPQLPTPQSQPRMQYISAKMPLVTPAAPTALAISITPVAQTWAFDSNRTLRDTISDWAKAAGWKEPVWKASNPYRVAGGEAISGGFIDALRKVADAVPALDMKANPATRELVISDSGQ